MAAESSNFTSNPLTANEDQITQRTEAANNLSSMVIKWLNSLNAYGAMYDTTYVYRLSRAERAVDSALSAEAMERTLLWISCRSGCTAILRRAKR